MQSRRRDDADQLSEVTRQNVETITAMEKSKGNARIGARIANGITNACGSLPFVALHVAWFALWIGINTIMPKAHRFDPFPFTFLTLVVSLEAIFLSAFILMSEKNQMAADERRAQLDLHVNLLSEQENTQKLRLLSAIARKLDIEEAADPRLSALEEATRPERLLEQIEEAQGSTAKER